MSIATIEKLSFSYDLSNNILENINLSINPGEFILLVGENGVGKSTLLRIIAGKHLIKDYNYFNILGNSSPNDQFNGLAYLGNNWSRNVSFVGNLNYCSDIKVKHLMEKQQHLHLKKRDKLVELLDIDLEWSMNQVSDGQRKKVQIMLALLKPFKLLVIDEFTNELDVVVRDNFFNYLKSECIERNASIIYATHIFDNLDSYITHAIFMSNKTCEIKKTLQDFNNKKTIYLSVKNKIINNKNKKLSKNFIDKKLLGPQGGWSSGRSQNIN